VQVLTSITSQPSCDNSESLGLSQQVDTIRAARLMAGQGRSVIFSSATTVAGPRDAPLFMSPVASSIASVLVLVVRQASSLRFSSLAALPQFLCTRIHLHT
jgi:hypothetical protein